MTKTLYWIPCRRCVYEGNCKFPHYAQKVPLGTTVPCLVLDHERFPKGFPSAILKEVKE